ncbi:MAG: hypothetical protein ACD_5C00142G0003 [uncultured bacterium]|nr:MAG: hypothetical protein ACD_5C00142G0003 [uncultured bacterium]
MADPRPNFDDINENIRAKNRSAFESAFEEADNEVPRGNFDTNNNAETERNRREQELIDALNSAREQFASTEYHDRSRMERIMKALNMRPTKEESPNIASARDAYQASLRQYLDFQIEKLQLPDENGNILRGDRRIEEIKKIHSFYNLDEATKYYDARTEAKMDSLASEKDINGNDKGFVNNAWDKIRLTSTKVSQWYKEQPTSYKLGLGVAAFAAGSASWLALGKRAWGAAMVMTTLGANLDQLAQKKDSIIDSREGNKFAKEIWDERGELDVEKIRSILGGKIDDIDDKLNKKNVRSGFNRIAAFSAAIFLGATTAEAAVDLANNGTGEGAATGGKIFGRLFNGKAEMPVGASGVHDGAGAARSAVGTIYGPDNADTPYTDAFEGRGVSDGSELPPIPKTGIFSDGAKGFDYVTPSGAASSYAADKFDHVTPSGAMNATEQAQHVKEVAAAEAARTETISIKEPVKMSEGGRMRHDSFIRSLKDHLKEQPGIDNDEAAHIAEVTFHDAAKEYAGKHGISYEKAVAKLSRIHPGTTYDLTWDEQGHPHMRINEDEVKFVKEHVHHHPTEPHVENVRPVEDLTLPIDNTENVPNDNIDNATDVPRDTVADYSRLETELQTEDAIHEMDKKYSEAASDALMNPDSHDGPSVEQYEKMGTFDQARKDFRELLKDMRAQDMPWLGESNIQTLIENGAESKQILRVSLNNLTEGHISKSGYWSEIKNQPAMKVAFDNGKMNERFASVVKQFQEIKGVGDKALPISENETTAQWIARITKLALKNKG